MVGVHEKFETLELAGMQVEKVDDGPIVHQVLVLEVVDYHFFILKY